MRPRTRSFTCLSLCLAGFAALAPAAQSERAYDTASGPLSPITTDQGTANSPGSGGVLNAHAFEDRDPVPLHTFPAGLQLVSSPAILSQRFETLGIDAAAYDPVSMQYVFTPIPPADTFHLGEGLWLLLAQPTPVFGSLPPIAIVFDVPLRAGWNLIGDPYLRIVPLSGVSFVDAIGSVHPLGDAITDGSISTLYGYHTVHRVYTRIDSSGSIEPWTGYWIYSSAAGSLRVEPLRT